MNKAELGRIYGKNIRWNQFLLVYRFFMKMQPTCRMAGHLILATYSTGLRHFTFFLARCFISG